jgi:hypothetical protein
VRRATCAASVLALLLAACGLEILPYLDPPGDSIKASPGTAVFYVINQATLIAEFRGFELYYKFYSLDQDTERMSQQSLPDLAALQAAGFHRMCSPGHLSEQDLPLIPVDLPDRNTTFTTEIDFSIVETAEPSADYQGLNPPTVNPILLRRVATDGSENTKTFEQSALDAADTDLVGVTWPSTPGDSLNLVVYALSYGLKDISTPLYSTPRYLGYMAYNF